MGQRPRPHPALRVRGDAYGPSPLEQPQDEDSGRVLADLMPSYQARRSLGPDGSENDTAMVVTDAA